MTSLNTETPANDAPDAQANSTVNTTHSTGIDQHESTTISNDAPDVQANSTEATSTGIDQDESTTISKEPESDTDDTKTADPNVNPETDNVEGHPDTEKTKLQMVNFIKRFRIYDRTAWSYIPYDPSNEEVYRPVERDDVDNYFYVDVRYQKAGDTPQLHLHSFSNTLLSFLRKTIGDDFFAGDPEYALVDLYPHLTMLRKKLAEAKALLLDASDAEKADTTLSFIQANGFAESQLSTHDEVVTCLKDLVDHLEVLVAYVTQEFQPTADKLALVTSYGHIEFDLLKYFFEVEKEVVTVDDFGLPFSFIISSTYYSIGTEKYFSILGYQYTWNGSAYVHNFIERHIAGFKGTAECSSLAVVHITPEVKLKLHERGRLYTAYSGLHYRSYNTHRVIVDRMGFGEQVGYVRDPNQIIPTLEEEKLHLLPSEIYGFDLVNKRWTSFLVEHLEPVNFDENAWDHLVLDPNIKMLIKGLVEVTKNSNSTDKIIKDVISGKGGGLIAVLHGPPGTGKTLTAEAVAELLRRPLYMVGSSELPSQPFQLESSLRTILSLATAWDAVLLIDEADVYLEQRSLHDLERNALVSVALRLLEYHRGVLFLTTNRIKTFDEAFLSRFSIAIKYPELDRAGRYTVWRKFFELAGSTVNDTDTQMAIEGQKSIERADVEKLAEKNFNGRTIKNIVRTAQALALSSGLPLSIAHVQVVLAAQEKFLDEFSSLDRLQ